MDFELLSFFIYKKFIFAIEKAVDTTKSEKSRGTAAFFTHEFQGRMRVYLQFKHPMSI